MKINHHRKPTKQEMTEDLGILVKDKERMDEAFDALGKALGDYHESPLHNSAYLMFDHFCDLYAKRYDIDVEDMYWFFFENESGACGLSIEITESDGTTVSHVIKGVDDFVNAFWK